MKIVNRKDFLAMPEGTLFCKYTPCFFDDISIKGESLINDFFYQQLVHPIAKDSGELFALLDSAEQSGETITNDLYCEGRDGCFDDDQMFLIFEPKDLLDLIRRLAEAHTAQTRIKP